MLTERHKTKIDKSRTRESIDS